MMCGMSGIAFAQQEPLNTTELGGNLGCSSDYFFRGASQMDGQMHCNLGLKGETHGLYGGAWIGNVDFNDDASYEYDLFLGYNLDVTDKLNIDVGAIQYRYDEGYDMTEEVYAGVNYGMLSVRGYQNTDNDDTYAEAILDISNYIPVVDVSLHYGRHDDDNDFSALTVGHTTQKGINLFATIILDSVMDGEVFDSVSTGFSYNF